MSNVLVQDLPYESIGKAVVALFAIVTMFVIVVVSIAVFVALWIRGWTWVSNRMYRGYDVNPQEKRPPLWKVRISGVALGLARFKFRKIPAAYREAEELAGSDTTFRQYLSRVFSREN